MFFQKWPILTSFLFIIRKRIRKIQKIQKKRQKRTCVWNFTTIMLIINKIEFRVDASLNFLSFWLLNVIYPLQYPLQYPTSTSKQIPLRSPPPSKPSFDAQPGHCSPAASRSYRFYRLYIFLFLHQEVLGDHQIFTNATHALWYLLIFSNTLEIRPYSFHVLDIIITHILLLVYFLTTYDLLII